MASFQSMTVAQLKQYLKTHQQNQSGNKAELIKRAQATAELFLVTPCSSGPRLVEDCTESDSEIARKNNFVSTLKSWSDIDAVSSEDWPELSEKEVFNFLLYSKRKGAKKQIKAKNFYDCRHVHSIKYHHVDTDSTECHIKALVIPSAAPSDAKKLPDYNVWVELSKITAHITDGHCSCPAGMEGACNHVAAVLYALVDVSESKKQGLDSATSSKCKWNTPRKRKLSPEKAENMVDVNKGAKKLKGAASTSSMQSAVNIAEFLIKLRKESPSCGLVINMSAAEGKQDSLPNFPKPKFSYRDSIDLSSSQCQNVFDVFLRDYDMAPEAVLQVEIITRGQSNNKMWQEARKCLLTSSVFGRIIKRKRNSFPKSIIKAVMGYDTAFVTKQTDWGLSHEKEAGLAYLERQKNSHPDIKMSDSGLILCSNRPYLAASPDGLVCCCHCSPPLGLLEIKCPFSCRNLTPADACSQSNFFCELVEGEVKLKKDHIYYYQVQGQMGVTGRKWCDFVVYTMRGMTVERIYFDENLWKFLISELTEFYRQHIIPEMFTSRVLRAKQ